ncbi:MAG: hypothetical protein A2138_26990 [Deltaproteobacteria bacterium RBG_16_71_12]|nr:MAG: hypothetical protein A2138_26990 [Deltaproteobacteria bacterium RBG_16_71_12]
MRHLTLILLATACFPALAGPALTKARVLEIIKDAEPVIAGCGRMLAAPETVDVRFVIDVEGGVHLVKVQGKHADDAIGRCLVKEVGALRFSHGLKPTPVRYPFKLGGRVAKNEPAPTTKPSGRLTQKDLDGLLKIIGDDLQRCGDGVAQTEFTIKKTGKVGGVRVRDVDAETGKCISTKLSRARFPAPAKPTLVQRSFSLDEG